MLRLKAERRSPSTVSGATASESTITKTPDVVNSTHTHRARNPRAVAPRDDPLALFRGLKFALLFEVVAVALIVGACFAVSFLANHLPNLILGACIVLLGILFGAMLAAKA